MKLIKQIVILLFAACVLSGCLPDNNIPRNKDDIKIVEGQLGTQKLFIPKKYFADGNTDFSDGSITIEMQIPEFIPLIKTTGEMWKNGEQTKYIRLLISYSAIQVKSDDYVKNRIDFFKVFETVGSEYGLTHLTQPNGYVKDHDDLWVERQGGKNISYINCSEQLTKNSVPQCSHHFEIGDLYIIADYDKRNLPHWKMIRDGILETFDSFKTPVAASDVLFNKYTNFIIKNEVK